MTRSVLKNGRKTTRIINLYLCFDSVDLSNDLITKNIDHLINHMKEIFLEIDVIKYDYRVLARVQYGVSFFK